VFLAFGIVFGSFANVLIARLPDGQSIGGRSRCPACSHELSPADLIPLLSWLWLRARCRYCRAPISARYPAVELLTGVLFLATWRSIGIVNLQLAIHLIYCLAMIVIIFTDFERAIIPNTVVLPIAAIALGAAVFGLDPAGPSLLAGLLTAMGGAGLFLLLYVISGGGGMGMGDVKLMLFLGLALGPLKVLLTVLAGSVPALLVAAVVMTLFRPRLQQLKSVSISMADEEEPEIEERFLGIMMINGRPAVPLGTFLAMGYFFAQFFGDQVIKIWLGF
jgi:leader peptidase (prepilin peptidase)/N-methyltransferase